MEIEPEYAGAKARCPECGGRMLIPSLEESLSHSPTIDLGPPIAPPPEPEPQPEPESQPLTSAPASPSPVQPQPEQQPPPVQPQPQQNPNQPSPAQATPDPQPQQPANQVLNETGLSSGVLPVMKKKPITNAGQDLLVTKPPPLPKKQPLIQTGSQQAVPPPPKKPLSKIGLKSAKTLASPQLDITKISERSAATPPEGTATPVQPAASQTNPAQSKPAAQTPAGANPAVQPHQNSMQCPKCGAFLTSPDAVICIDCGYNVKLDKHTQTRQKGKFGLIRNLFRKSEE